MVASPADQVGIIRLFTKGNLAINIFKTTSGDMGAAPRVVVKTTVNPKISVR
jgi:hypothetical protein